MKKYRTLTAILMTVTMLLSNSTISAFSATHEHGENCYNVECHIHDINSECQGWYAAPGVPCPQCRSDGNGGHGYLPCPQCNGIGNTGVTCTGTYRFSREVEDTPYKHCYYHDDHCAGVSSKSVYVKCDVCGDEVCIWDETKCERGFTVYVIMSSRFDAGDSYPIKHSDTNHPYKPCTKCNGSTNSDVPCSLCNGTFYIERPCTTCGGNYTGAGTCTYCNNGIYTIDASKCRTHLTWKGKDVTKRTSVSYTIEEGNWYFNAYCYHCGVRQDFTYNGTLTYYTSGGKFLSHSGVLHMYEEGSNIPIKSKSYNSYIDENAVSDLFTHRTGDITCPKCNGTTISDCNDCYQGIQMLGNLCTKLSGAYNPDGSPASTLCHKVVTKILVDK